MSTTCLFILTDNKRPKRYTSRLKWNLMFADSFVSSRFIVTYELLNKQHCLGWRWHQCEVEDKGRRIIAICLENGAICREVTRRLRSLEIFRFQRRNELSLNWLFASLSCLRQLFIEQTTFSLFGILYGISALSVENKLNYYSLYSARNCEMKFSPFVM